MVALEELDKMHNNIMKDKNKAEEQNRKNT